MLAAAMLTEQYETLRSYVLARNRASGSRLGQGTMMAHGMVKWMQVAGELIVSLPSAVVSSEEAASMPLPVHDEVIRFMGGAVIALVCGGAL